MPVIRRPDWWMPENLATPEHVYVNRRRFLAQAGFGAGALASASLLPFEASAAGEPLIAAELYPPERNPAYTVDRPITGEDLATTYNNFYEFGSHKRISEAAQRLELRPWEVVLDGLVEEEIRIDAEELIRKMSLEERVYRFRCVEAWAMTVPWVGFPMADLVAFAKPLSGAKYVRMETFLDKDMAPGQREFWYPWPYVEGLTSEEATHDLAFIGTGIYGKPMPKQNGAPIRLITPWKYGFKSIKSVVRFSFTEERPVSFWEEVQSREYGFWANVNPEVSHPRWSQAMETPLGTRDKRPTLLYNGYAELIGDLYKGLEGERLFM
ncbi:MAG: protein-methionine-sulfoxide reductase catalytic subunit MsrP [Geminicoccaceae bacterium]